MEPGYKVLAFILKDCEAAWPVKSVKSAKPATWRFGPVA